MRTGYRLSISAWKPPPTRDLRRGRAGTSPEPGLTIGAAQRETETRTAASRIAPTSVMPAHLKVMITSYMPFINRIQKNPKRIPDGRRERSVR